MRRDGVSDDAVRLDLGIDPGVWVFRVGSEGAQQLNS
jgi:hypothetical protein